MEIGCERLERHINQIDCSKHMNPYKTYLDKIFNRIIELRHIASHINITLLDSIKNIEKSKKVFLSGSALVISDWTGPTNNGWEINFHTGIRKTTYKENYINEVDSIISQECCHAFAQSFEALERFIKDCLFAKIQRDSKFKAVLGFPSDDKITRTDLPGGDKLFKYIKKAGDPNFSKFSSTNNSKIKFKEFWAVISQSRHAIIHSNSEISNSKINISKHHLDIFSHFFNSYEPGNQVTLIMLNYRMLDKLLKAISEFAFQIFKALSINENLDWVIDEK
ncbi:MAG: hypothetical protein ACOCUI_05510 [bacterium]